MIMKSFMSLGYIQTSSAAWIRRSVLLDKSRSSTATTLANSLNRKPVLEGISESTATKFIALIESILLLTLSWRYTFIPNPSQYACKAVQVDNWLVAIKYKQPCCHSHDQRPKCKQLWSMEPWSWSQCLTVVKSWKKWSESRAESGERAKSATVIWSRIQDPGHQYGWFYIRSTIHFLSQFSRVADLQPLNVTHRLIQ